MSGSLLDFPIFEQFPASSQDALDLVFARCSADPACAAAYPDPAGDLTAITARLDAGPVTLTDPATGRSGQMTRDDLATGIHELLLDTSTAAVLPRLLHSAAAGNWADVLAAQPGAEPEESDGPSGVQVMNLTIMCWEPWASLRRAQTDAAAEGSYLRYPDVRAMTLPEDVCAVVPRPPAEAMYGPVTPVDVPVLLMNGAADPQDPPANVAGAREAFPDSVSLTVPNQGHHFAITACQAGILAAFVDRASTTGWSSECLRDTPAPPFDLGGSCVPPGVPCGAGTPYGSATPEVSPPARGARKWTIRARSRRRLPWRPARPSASRRSSTSSTPRPSRWRPAWSWPEPRSVACSAGGCTRRSPPASWRRRPASALRWPSCAPS
jgi:hypothetical protein